MYFFRRFISLFQLPSTRSAGFIERLEATRGIAAMVVAFHHAFRIILANPNEALAAKVMTRLFYGLGAVYLFFVLSGLVLGLSLRRGPAINPREYCVFIVRRLFRLWPAMAVSITAFAAYYIFIVKHNNYEPAGFLEWPKVTLGLFCQNLFFVDHSINRVTWSLTIEMVGSLALPIMHCLSRGPVFRRITLLGAFVCVTALFVHHRWDQNNPIDLLLMFYAGYLLSGLQPLSPDRQKESRTLWWVLSLGALCVCVATHHFGNNPLLFTAGATLLIGLIASNADIALFRALDHPFFRLMGRISYSFYLFHPLVLDILSRVCLDHIGLKYLKTSMVLSSLVLGVISTLLAIPVSIIVYRAVELPFIAFGKSVSRSLATTRRQTPAQALPSVPALGGRGERVESGLANDRP